MLMKIDKEKLQLAMANMCISTKELAVQAGIAEQNISAYMSGRKNPKPMTVGKIAKVLQVKVEDIIKTETN